MNPMHSLPHVHTNNQRCQLESELVLQIDAMIDAKLTIDSRLFHKEPMMRFNQPVSLRRLYMVPLLISLSSTFPLSKTADVQACHIAL